MPLIPRAPRTVKLNGDPLKWSLTSVFNSCREAAHAAYLALPLLAGAVVQGETGAAPLAAAAGAAVGIGLSALMYRNTTEKWDLVRAFGAAHDKRYVIKDNKDAVTSPQDMLGAYTALRLSRFNLSVELVLASLFAAPSVGQCVAAIVDAAPYNPAAAFVSGVFLTDIFSEMGNIHRFRKVIKGEWVITDTPPPVHSSEKFSVDLPQFSRPQPALGATYQHST